MEQILEVTDLKMHFGGVKAVDGLSFYLSANEFLGIIGPNGSGKTTVYNALTGVYKPTAGKVVFLGRDITGEPMYNMVRFGLARTFQNLRSYRGMTALENVMMGYYINDKTNFFDALLHTPRFHRYEKESRELAIECLKLVGMENMKDEYVGSMPYGMQKRIELCRALVTEPKMLLLDEPTAGLNSYEASKLIENVIYVKSQRSLAVIMIEHNMRVMMSASDRVLAMDAGKLIAMGLPSEVQNNSLVIKAYLGEEKQ